MNLGSLYPGWIMSYSFETQGSGIKADEVEMTGRQSGKLLDGDKETTGRIMKPLEQMSHDHERWCEGDVSQKGHLS